MPKFLFANNAKSSLAAGIAATDTTIYLAAGDGAKFPSPGTDEQFALTLVDAAKNIEIVYCTGRTNDTLTVVRGQEGTTALAFASGDEVGARITKGVLDAMMQSNDNIPSGTNMIFQQAAAPKGWTQRTDLNDRVLRLVSGATGGNTGGSWTISGVTVDGHVLTEAEIPAHTHTGTTDPTSGRDGGFTDVANLTNVYSPPPDNMAPAVINHTHTFTTDPSGGGQAHSHGLTADGTWRPAYVDIIACTKN